MKDHVKQWEAVVAAIGAERRGIVNDSLLRNAGLGEHVAPRLRERGVLVSIARGVDRLRDHPFGYLSRCRAALDLAGPGAVLGGRTAARVHGLYAYRSCEEITVHVPRGRDHRTSIGQVVETRWLPTAHVTVVDGLPVTTLARTFFDLCGSPPRGMRVNHPAHERAMARVYNDALARHGLTFTTQVAVFL